jgi:hypothetical protein
MEKYFFIILFCSFFINILIYQIIKDCTFFGKKSSCDSEKNLVASVQSTLFEKLSSVHNIKKARSQCRELHFFFVKFINKIIFRNIIEDKVNIFLHLTSNFIFTIFFYLFFKNIFDEKTSFFLSLLFIFSMWSYQICIYWGHIILSTMWFIIAMYVTTLIKLNSDIIIIYIYTAIISLFSALTYFSSSSSRKYIPIIYIFFLFSLHKKQILNLSTSNENVLIFLAILIAFFIFFTKFEKLILHFLYFILSNNLINKIKKHKLIFKKILKLFIHIFIFFLTPLIFSKFSFHLFSLLSLFYFVFIFFCYLVFYPKFSLNIFHHFSFLDVGVWSNHFNAYPKKYFNKYNINKHFRGGEWYIWLPRFFLRISTIPFILYASSIIFFFYYFSIEKTTEIFFMLMSILALLVAEFSGMIRVSKAYYPVFFGFFLGIGTLINYVLNYENLSHNYLFILFSLIFILHLGIEINKLFFDVIPSRMYQINLKNFLLKNKIKKFSTFKTSFNDGAITPMLDKFGNFKVDYVEKISDSRSNYFVCPPLSSKSISLETDQYAIKYGDFDHDPQIKKLIANKDFDKKSLIKFKTFASSKIFVLESEVTGFRDLCLNDISKYDRWIGFSRIFLLKNGQIV